MVVTAVVLAAFAILFGTRRYSASGRNDAVLYAVAVESLIKLAALVAVALFAIVLVANAPKQVQRAGLTQMSARFAPSQIRGEFLVITGLAMTAIVCLPRQFHIGMIGADSAEDASASRWPFIAYLGAITIAVLTIILAGLTTFRPVTHPTSSCLTCRFPPGPRGLRCWCSWAAILSTPLPCRRTRGLPKSG